MDKFANIETDELFTELVKRIKKQSNSPVLFISALGAEDYTVCLHNADNKVFAKSTEEDFKLWP